jgi:predicted nucleic acid-binding protein
MLLAVVVSACVVSTTAIAQDGNEPSSIKIHSGIVPKPKANGYGESWALIIGINYENAASKVPAIARGLVPKLNNAENDAAELQKVLVNLYGYRKDHVIPLIGATATKEAIERELNAFKDKIKPNHSVLVFFSGHGTRIENMEGERGAIYAADVGFTEAGRPKNGYLRMHLDVLKTLKEDIPAKHKLLILDCCHSGEIFSLSARARSDVGDRRALALFEADNSIQAIASCRDRQRASDGSGKNSPFTAALLQALRRIPAREGIGKDIRSRVGVNQLFIDMLPELKNLTNGQSPDCRSLGNVDGEFAFFPASTQTANEEFDKYFTSAKEFRTLQAMVPGDHGNWWFEEMPWFIPSLRLMILDKAAPEKSALQSSAIRREELQELAVELHRDLEKALADSPVGIKRTLVKLRLSHAHALRYKSGRESQKVVETIISDFESLEKSEEKEQLEASDLHLLAVCKHYLQRKTDDTEKVEAVETAYTEALRRFDVSRPNELTLKSLCHADYGLFLSSVKRDYKNAATQFRNALSLFGSDLMADVASAAATDELNQSVEAIVPDGEPTREVKTNVSRSAPAAFRVFVLCSEASAWQQQNLWGKANDLFTEAHLVAKGFDEDHQLTVFVLNQIAWAQMVQWHIGEATKNFDRANAILLKLAQSTDDAGKAPIETKSRQQQFQIMLGGDYNALERYLHHLHGLAMAKRFHGQQGEAISDYREIVRMITVALDHLKHGTSTRLVASDIESKLLNRLVNSQERLADCNLFGNPDNPDLQEASDDYRRALNACAFLPPGDSRDNWRMRLLFKLALALSIPSTAQDLELARAYCREATELKNELKVRPADAEGTLGLVSEAVVSVFSGSAKSLNAENAGANVKEVALNTLRRQLHDLCDLLQGSAQRDQLETLLLATKLLVDQVPVEDRYHLAEDSELLLYLCRLILPRGTATTGNENLRQETGSYLHAYYDTAIRSKLRMKPSHVKDLLEIQWEATRSEFYTKPSEPRPVLALYLLDDKCYLLLDVPGGASIYRCQEGNFYMSTLKLACEGTTECLPLPDDIQQEVIKLRTRKEMAPPHRSGNSVATTSMDFTVDQGTILELRWADPVRGLSEQSLRVLDEPQNLEASSRRALSTYSSTETEGSSKPQRPDPLPNNSEAVVTVKVQTFKPVKTRFPFILPNGIAANQHSD